MIYVKALSSIMIILLLLLSPVILSLHYVKAQNSFLTYCNDKYHLQFQYPLGWIPQYNGLNPIITLTAPPGMDNGISYGPAHAEIKFAPYNVINQPPAPDVAASNKLQEYYKTSNFMLLGGGPVQFSQQDDLIPPPIGYYIEYTNPDAKFGPAKEIEVFVNDNGAAYVQFDFGFFSNPTDFDNHYSKIFNQIINSINIAYAC
jgi:hypothetical protein